MAADGERSALNTCPSTNPAAPADDGVEDAGIVLDLGVLEDNTLLDAGASANGDTGANAHVGAQLGGGVDVGGGVDEDRGHNVGAGRRELVAAGLGGLLEVEGVGGDGGASSLDLTPEVLSLVDVELLAVGHITQDILLEADDLVLLALIIIIIVGEDEAVLEVIGGGVRDEARGSVEAALNGRADGGEDSLSRKEIDTAINEVANARLGLLDVVQHTAGVGVGDDAAEVGGSLVAHAGTEDDGLGILLDEEAQHLIEGEGAADVSVEDKEALRAALEDGIAKVVETASGTERLVLAEVLDGDGGELLGGVLDEVAEDGLIVVANDVDLLDLLVRDAGDGAEAVPDDGVAGDLEEGLGDVEGEGAEAGASRRATDLGRVSGLEPIEGQTGGSEAIPG